MSTHCIDKSITHETTTSTPLMPATALLQQLWKTAKLRIQRRKDRRELQSLLSLNADHLKDIGLTKGDVQWATNLPLSRDASTELEIISRRSSR